MRASRSIGAGGSGIASMASPRALTIRSTTSISGRGWPLSILISVGRLTPARLARSIWVMSATISTLAASSPHTDSVAVGPPRSDEALALLPEQPGELRIVRLGWHGV